MTRLSLNGLGVEIGDTRVCQDLSLQIKGGQVWSVLGRNGVGKSTLLKTLAGLRPPQSGRIDIDEQPLSGLPRRDRARRLGILFQDSDTLFPTTVLETVLTGRHPWVSTLQGESEEDVAVARQALRRVGLEIMGERSIATLSGGERRRVDLATLMVQEPRVYLLDEPSNHLDLHYQVAVLGGLIDDWRRAEGAVILVMHDVNLALRFSDHLIFLQGDGQVEWGEAPELATESRLSRLYGHQMLQVTTTDGRWFFPA